MALPASPSSAQTKPRKRSVVSTALENNLSSYALAAGSAGVALLACVQPADAKVVITKVDIPVPINAGPVNFDINGDGQNDFGLSAVNFPTNTCTDARSKPTGKNGLQPLGCFFNDRLNVIPVQAANEVWQVGLSYYGGEPCAADLGRGVRIDRLRPFAAGKILMTGDEGTSIGHQLCHSWTYRTNKHYLGVKFLDKESQVHYGWVRVINDFNHATITAYAYETVPNEPIIAGESTEGTADASMKLAPDSPSGEVAQPASLGFLALGASGIAAWRREGGVLAQ
jgi:hypothetical protein